MMEEASQTVERSFFMENKGMTFYLVRHGETYFNYYGRMQGWSNTPLTENGKEDVRRSGRGLADVKFDAIYTSDLSRTIETANLILEENHATEDKTLHSMPEFREVFFGSMEGMYGSEAYAKVAEHMGFESVKEMFRNTTIPERMNGFHDADPDHYAEDFMTFWSRIERGLLELVDRHRDTGETILLVAHGQTIRYMLQSLVAELEEPDNLLNASVCKVHYHSGKFHVERYNDVTHFKDADK